MKTERLHQWKVAVLTLAVANPALADARGSETGAGAWLILFLALGALVIAFQAVPALVMLGSMLKALFAPAERHPQMRGEADRSARG